MKKNNFIYELVTNDIYEFPVFFADTMLEMAQLTGFNVDRLTSALRRDTAIDGYKIYRVDMREPEEKFTLKEYKLFCKKNNLKEGHFSSIKAFRKYCYGEL